MAARTGSDAVSGRLGQLLLSGYTMLADSCPECAVPLMQAPGGGAIICVSCEASGPAAAPTTNGPSLTNGHPLADLETEEDDEVLVPSHIISAQQQEQEEEEDIVEAPVPLRERLAATQALSTNQDEVYAGATSHVSASVNEAEAVHDHSQEIADKLLEGWTMLAESCPVCYTPLLRNKELRIYCAKCQLFVVHERDLHPSPPPAVANPAPSLAPPAPAPAAIPAPVPIVTRPIAPAAAAPPPPPPVPVVVERALGQPVTPSAPQEDADAPGSVVECVEEAVCAVALRLWATSLKLQNADFENAEKILKEIRQATATLKELKDVKVQFSVEEED